MNAKTISCAQHDYVEIACLYGYRLRLILQSGESISGQAKTIKTTSDQKEWLILESDPENPHQTQHIELIQLQSMQALTPNPHFDHIELSNY